MYIIRLNNSTHAVTISKVVKSVRLEQVKNTIILQQTGRPGSSGAPGLIQGIVAGDNVVVDSTDPAYPIMSAQVESAVNSVNGMTGDVVITKNSIGLGNVPNLNTTTAVADAHTHSNKSILDATTASFTSSDKTKLDGIQSGAQVNNISNTNATDLTDGGDSSLHYHGSDRNRANHTGTQSADTIVDGTLNKVYTAGDKTKLAGIASGAEVNVNADWNAISGDAQILNKPTIPVLPSNIVESVAAGTNVTIDNTDPANPVISATGGGGGGAVDSVNGQTGVVVLDTDDINDTAGNRYTNDTDVMRLANTTGTNTGDQDLTPFFNKSVDDSDDITQGSSKLFLTTAERTKLSNTSGTNTGDQTLSGLGGVPTTRTINGLDLSANRTLTQDNIGDGTTYKQYSQTEKTKLAGIATGAEVNVNADWNSASGDSQILNKPTIPTQYTDELAQDAVGGILIDSSTLDFTYDDAAPSITAAVLNSPQLNGQAASYYLNRTNHTGTQTASTISDFNTAASAAAPVQSVAGKTGTVILVKGDVGLGNVDNTSDATKNSASATLTNKDFTSGTNTFPIFNQNTTGSAAKLTTARNIAGVAFDGTANISLASTNLSDSSSIVTLTGSQTLTNKTLTSPAISTPTGIVKADVGLGNVDNTSNATERAATATLTNKTLTAPVINNPTGFAVGWSKLTVGTTAPSSPSVGDPWIDTN